MGTRAVKKIVQEEIDVGRRIRAARRARGITQAELAKIAGMGFQQIQKYERAESRLHVVALLRICAAIKVAPNDLLNLKDEDLISIEPGFAYENSMSFELIKAFSAVKSNEIRRSIVRIVRSLAQQGGL